MLYVGVDAHRETSWITLMDEAGAVVKRQCVPSTQEGVRRLLEKYDCPKKAVLEASYCWGPMYDWLDELTDEVLLAHPLKLRAIAEARIKTDKIDSEMLAHLLRANLIPEAHAPSKEVRSLKRVLRQRLFFVKVQTMLKNRLMALLAQHSVQRPEVSDLYGKSGLEWLRGLELPEPDGEILREDLALLEVVWERIAATEALIQRLSEGDEVVKWLESLPGIGEFFSVLIRYEVDDIGRFRDAKKFASYTGLVPSTYRSALKVAHGRLTKQGNKWLRWAFVEAVTPAVRCSPWIRGYYERLKARRGAKDARTATARKLAELVWKVWTERRCYEEW